MLHLVFCKHVMIVKLGRKQSMFVIQYVLFLRVANEATLEKFDGKYY